MPGHLFECKPEDEVTTPRGMTPPLHFMGKGAGSKYNLTSGLSPGEELQRQAEFHSSTKYEA